MREWNENKHVIQDVTEHIQFLDGITHTINIRSDEIPKAAKKKRSEAKIKGHKILRAFWCSKHIGAAISPP